MVRTPSSRFSRVLKDARRAAGLTQEQLAEQTGVSARTILRWERGNITKPRGDELMAVADSVGIPREDALRAVGWLPDAPDNERTPEKQVAELQAELDDMIARFRQLFTDDSDDADSHSA